MGLIQKKYFAAQVKVKDAIEDVFLIKNILLQEGRDGRAYLNVILGDNSGEMEARYFGPRCLEFFDQYKKGDFILAKGRVNLFQNKKQFILHDLELISKKDIQETDFILQLPNQRPNTEMYEELLHLVQTSVNDRFIKPLLLQVLHDESIKERLLVWPAGKTVHHAYPSGLLEHILSCCHLAQFLSPHYQVNLSYVLAGCIFHDLGKIYELSNNHLLVEYTDEGKLIGHLQMGLEMIDLYSQKIDSFPQEMKMHLKHLILSHHGSYEFGSPKLPQTSEAMLVHLIDFLDSKMNSFHMIKQTDMTAGTWSNYIKHLDRIIYKQALPSYPES